ncbi:MAG: helix-turn-helix domain-containing protein [Nitrospirota bacterium]
MVVNNLVHHLREAGLTEYEARAYITLVRENPLTAYEIARRSGIPTSKVYGVVSRLAERGVLSVRGEGRARSYVPIDAEEFVSGLRGRIHDTLVQIEGGLATLGLPDSPGVPQGTAQDTLIAPYNDLEAVKALLAANPRGPRVQTGASSPWPRSTSGTTYIS